MKLPSERIKEIFIEESGVGALVLPTELEVIARYLDELHEQQKPCEHKYIHSTSGEEKLCEKCGKF